MKKPLSEIRDSQPRRDHGDLSGLKASIVDVGLINPLTIDEQGHLLAGRRRFQALTELGWTECEVNMLATGGDPFRNFRVALDENLKRKQLTDPEVAVAIAEYDRLKREREGESPRGRRWDNSLRCGELEGWSQERTAEELGISRQAVGKAIQIATAIEEFPELAAKSGQAILQEVKRRKLPLAQWPSGKFSVIYADPPWQYDNSGFDQSAASQYPTMSSAAIQALPVADLCTPASVLFLWVTSPQLPIGLEVLEAWGFDYKASMVWCKQRSPGMGWFVQTEHEHLLIGTREDNSHPGIKPHSVLTYRPGKHSAKPVEVYGLIEAMYAGPYMELFARGNRPGWEAWGNEVSG